MKKSSLLIPILSLLVASSVQAEWPQYRGPQSDGTTAEALTGKISLGEPQWKIPLHTGFSSFVASGDLVLTVVRRELEGNEHEMLLAIESASGKERWASPLSLAGAILEPKATRVVTALDPLLPWLTARCL
ncbi:MAG: hypothetical protein ACKVHP_01020 [Verrucomicrobiales bacterium]